MSIFNISMKTKKLLIAILLFGSIAGLTGFAKFDDDIIKRIATQLEKWTSDNPQEKVYLYLDKPYYAVGDNIWFKAYITVGAKHQLSALSGILNVELINDKDSIKKDAQITHQFGLSLGRF